ncbi:MAG: hypothetical protein EHM64_10345 [Ignavibacteriae bacterium]|nr:MAG: hypothetical protein EHM64_10345 [Ignavibacteriota bacterium]
MVKRKRRDGRKHFFFSSMLLMLILFSGCSSGLQLTSDWQQGVMNIDGRDADWQTGLYYDKESDMVYGIRNDDQYVYVMLKTQNRSTQRQIVSNGLTIWFDKENGKNQNFGIHYPMNRREPRGGLSEEPGEERSNTFFDQSFPELEVMGPKKEVLQQFPTLDAPGIRVKLGRLGETLLYELRVPLKKTSEHPFALEPVSGKRVGIEFETGSSQSNHAGGMHMGSGFRPGNPGGINALGDDTPAEGGRMSTGGEGPGGRNAAMERTKQMELWLSVQLARPSAR